MNTKITVVIPTYKRPQLLERCLLALLRQKFNKREYEIIVVSDGPDMVTRQLIEKIAKGRATNLRYLSLLVKKGPAAARNYGWLNARGRIIAFTDDDCLPDKNWLKEIFNNIQSVNFEAAITGRVIVLPGNRPAEYEQSIGGLETADFIMANSACTKAALIKVGGFDEQFNTAWREDSDLEFKLISENIPVKNVESAIVVHPVRQARWGESVKEQKKTLYNALLYKKFPQLYRQKIQPYPPVLYYAIIIAFMLMLIGYSMQMRSLAVMGFYAWIFLTFNFIVSRLFETRLSAGLIIEMIATSFIIPFVSIYWQWYGAIKYKVLFI